MIATFLSALPSLRSKGPSDGDVWEAMRPHLQRLEGHHCERAGIKHVVESFAHHGFSHVAASRLVLPFRRGSHLRVFWMADGQAGTPSLLFSIVQWNERLRFRYDLFGPEHLLPWRGGRRHGPFSASLGDLWREGGELTHEEATRFLRDYLSSDRWAGGAPHDACASHRTVRDVLRAKHKEVLPKVFPKRDRELSALLFWGSEEPAHISIPGPLTPDG